MIQVHGKKKLSIEFKSMIKAHDLNPWQFIYPKPNSHWQHQSPILISNIKTQFSLATSKPNSHLQYQSPIFIGNIKAQFSLATSKLNSHWYYQIPILISNIKAQFSLTLLYQKEKEPKINNAWQRKNIMVKCYRGKKDHGNHFIKKTH